MWVSWRQSSVTISVEYAYNSKFFENILSKNFIIKYLKKIGMKKITFKLKNYEILDPNYSINF